jgi:hypothetical protein
VAAAIQEKKKKSKKLFISLFFLLSRSFAWLSIKHAHKTHDTCFLFKLVREFLILFFHFMKQFLKNFDLFVLCFFCALCVPLNQIVHPTDAKVKFLFIWNLFRWRSWRFLKKQ